MKPYKDLTSEERAGELATLRERFAAYKERGLALNMARGKPAPEQLDLSLPLLNMLPAEGSAAELHAGAADDYRNYGGLGGIAAARELMGAILGVPAQAVLVHGNSSLTLMHNLVSLAMTHGVLGSTPWARLEETPKFLCPVPGYDRHFAICEHFGIEMIPVQLEADGPVMDIVERLVNTNPLVKGIWCVPRFSNPSGISYSSEVVERLARLNPAAPDFRIYWDNAYAVHELDVCGEPAEPAGAAAPTDAGDAAGATEPAEPSQAAPPAKAAEPATQLRNIKDACEEALNPNLWYAFASTSKITFAGSGIAALATSEANLASIKAAMAFQSIGPDKINQARHALFLPNLAAVRAHMAKHATLIKPKFELVERVLGQQLKGLGIARWNSPQGGYFIAFEGWPRTARRTVELAAEAGVVLTAAGATHPYGVDPEDAVIRIAPTYPSLEELELATEILATCARIAALER